MSNPDNTPAPPASDTPPGGGDNGLSDDYGSFDINNVIDSVSKSLFAPAPAPAPAPVGAAPTPPAPPTPPQRKPLPKAWKKEMEQHWSALDPSLHDYIYEREGDVSRGIQMYKTGHENWSKLVTPYNQLLQQYPDVNPVDLMSNLMKSHIQLSFGSDQERATLLKHLMTAYRITPEMLSGVVSAPAAPAAPQASQLEQRLNQLEDATKQRTHQENLKLVQNFFTDPKNEYAQELGQDILDLVQRGFNLEQAYERAMWTNPAVRAKVLAKQAKATAAPGAAALNLSAGDTGSRSPSAPRQGTIDDTINGVLSKHFGSGVH